MFLIVAIFAMSLVSAVDCTETDSGNDTLSVGVTTDTNYTYPDGSTATNVSTDHCFGDNLIEFACYGDNLYLLYTDCEAANGEGYYCENGACVAEEEETDYREFTFEYDSSIDLSDYDSSLSSVPGVYISTENNEIVLEPFLGTGYLADVHTLVETNEVWLYTADGDGVLSNGTIVDSGKWVAVFYRDLSDNQVKLYGHFDGPIDGLEILTLQPGETSYELITKRPPVFIGNNMIIMDLGFETTLSWGLDTGSGQFASLGRTLGTEEMNEIRFGTIGVGTFTENVSSRDGLTVVTPATYGASDMVVLNVPTSSGLSRAASAEDESRSLGEVFRGFWQTFFF